MVFYIVIFLIFSFLGWIIDSIYSTFEKGRIVSSGYFKGIPLCPIYGVGGILIYTLFNNLVSLESFFVILITSLTIISLEYFGGWFNIFVLGERLWDYRNMKFNLHGHISLLHSVYWVTGVSILYYLYGKFGYLLDNIYMYSDIYLSKYEHLISVVFMISIFVLGLKNWQRRKGISNKVGDE